LLCLLWILPIALQPDFGTVLVYVFTFAVLYWAMGGPLLHLLVSGLLAAPAAGLALATHPYLIDRLTAFLNPHAYANTAGWHLLQFRRALAAGGLTGQGWGHRQTQVHLPLGYSDSIFANTAEAIGFIGVLPLVLIVLAWVVYGVRRGAQCREPFAKAVVLGMVILLAGQAFIHLSVNLGLCPTTGITLPLISYGGSSLLASLTAVGIVEAVGRSATPLPAPPDRCATLPTSVN
jgi:cell division protein FtsW